MVVRNRSEYLEQAVQIVRSVPAFYSDNGADSRSAGCDADDMLLPGTLLTAAVLREIFRRRWRSQCR